MYIKHTYLMPVVVEYLWKVELASLPAYNCYRYLYQLSLCRYALFAAKLNSASDWPGFFLSSMALCQAYDAEL